MFEHLVSPQHQDFFSKKSGRIKFYSSSLLLALFIFASTYLSINQGPKTKAQNIDNLATDRVRLYSSDSDLVSSEFVLSSEDISVFSFVLDSPYENVSLASLYFEADGFLDENLLANLSLYHNQAQVNADAKILNKNLVFSFEDYILSKGKNYFRLTFAGQAEDLLNKKINFSLRDIDSVNLSINGKEILTSANFPVQGSDIVLLEQANLLAYNNLNTSEFIVPAGTYTKIADFSLSANGEAVDLRMLNFQVLGENISVENDFYLSSGGKILASSSLNEVQELSFQLASPILIKANQDLDLELWSSLELGNYEIKLDLVGASGFVSGKLIHLTQDLDLAKIKVLPTVLSVTSDSNRKSLSEGWNTIVDLKISNLGDQAAKLHKLTWDLDLRDLTVDALELWSGEKLLATAKIENSRAFFSFWQKNALDINTDISLELLAKVRFEGEDPQLGANLLFDKQSLQVDNTENFFLWSSSEKLYNSYSLVGLPLAPVVLE